MKAAVLLCCALALAPAAQAAGTPPPYKPAAAPEDGLLGRALGALVVACVAAGVLVYGAKRAGLGRAAPGRRVLERVDTLRLSQKSALYTVHYRGRQLLLAESEGGLRLLRDEECP
ncbi:MAG: hypothetical protein K0R43_415 [Pseudoduganella sp.]|jgi:hypothetical protein|nr:hypothetical protein [Pseudoduganella sp.]